MDFQFILVLIAVAVFVYWYFSKGQRIRRAFKSQQKTTIGSCKDHQTNRIQGELKLVTTPLTAPLTSRKCAVFTVKVEELHTKANNNSRSWSEIINHSSSTYFLLSDGKDYAFVLADDATIYLQKDGHFESGTFNDASDRLEAYLNAHAKSSTGLLGFNRKLRYREGVLEEGEQVAVCGKGRWQEVSKYAELDFLQVKGISKVFVFSRDCKEPLYISDDVNVLALQ